MGDPDPGPGPLGEWQLEVPQGINHVRARWLTHRLVVVAAARLAGNRIESSVALEETPKLARKN